MRTNHGITPCGGGNNNKMFVFFFFSFFFLFTYLTVFIDDASLIMLVIPGLPSYNGFEVYYFKGVIGLPIVISFRDRWYIHIFLEMGSLMTSSSSAGPIQISKFPEPWIRPQKKKLLSPPKKIKKSNGSLFSFLPRSAQRHRHTSGTKELDLYLSEDEEETGCNMMYWGLNSNKFPVLSKMAQIYLALPASSAPVERLFSIGKNFRAERCTCMLSDETFETLMFLKCNNVVQTCLVLLESELWEI